MAGDDMQQLQMHQRIGAAGPARMAAYWKRVGELRAEYLPRMTQANECMLDARKDRVSEGGGGYTKKGERLFSWISTTAMPMLQQREWSPCGSAQFTAEELDTLEEKLESLIVDIMETPITAAEEAAEAEEAEEAARAGRAY